MGAPVTTKTFKSGNSEAVRLPKGFGFGLDIEVKLERNGDTLVIRPAETAEKVRHELAKLVADLKAIGRPSDGVQQREPFEFPDRPGL